MTRVDRLRAATCVRSGSRNTRDKHVALVMRMIDSPELPKLIHSRDGRAARVIERGWR